MIASPRAFFEAAGRFLPGRKGERLHPVITTKVTAPFIRGDYETAVFQAFKEVEVAVRTAGAFSAQDIGVPLMRAAFRTQTGPLSDTSLPEAEQEALAHLFAGAIGYYKNPGSHRSVSISGADEAVEAICLASRLVKIALDREPGVVSRQEA